MNRYSVTLRSWLLAALYSATAFTFSCQRQEADTPKPVVTQPTKEALLAQEIIAAHNAFAASGYAAELKEVSPDGKLTHEWKPQWSAAFRAYGAIHVPLSLEGKQLGNAKHFLVVKDTNFSLVLLVVPSGQAIELVKNSPDFLRTFTGQLAWRQLGAKKARVYTYKQGQMQGQTNSATQGTKPATATAGTKTTTGNQGQRCVTTTTCLWEASCALAPGSVVYLSMTVGTNGSCEEPVVDGLCYNMGPTSWNMYRSENTEECEPDPTPGTPNPDPYPYGPRIMEGWYKINVVRSGLVLDVYSAYTANGTNVTECIENGGNNQKWYVTYLGPDVATGQEVYTFTPRSNYLYWQAMGTPPGPSMDQRLGVMPSGAPSTAIGAPVQIWAMSSFPGLGAYDTNTSPFSWRLSYAGLANLNGRTYNKYTFSNQYSDWYMNVSGGGPFPAGQLIQFPLTGNEGHFNDQFTFTKLPI